MKIILLTSELSEKNGWGRYSLELARAFKKIGHRVVVVCHKINKEEKEIEQIALLPDPLSYRFNYFLFFAIAIRVFFSVRTSKDIVVHCLVETYAPAAWLFSLLIGKPLFLTVHGSFGVKPFLYRWPGLVQKFIYLSSRTRVICVSQYTGGRLLAKIGEKIKLNVIPNGVCLDHDLAVMNARSEFGHVLLGVGALKKRKGFHLVIEALPKLIEKFPDLQYWIVGDQSDELYVQSIKEKIKKLNLGHSVKLRGNVDDSELWRLYRAAGLFVLTPLSDEYNFEGFGLVYLEANSFGLPVVGMKDNGGEEAIDDGQTGLLAETNKAESVFQAISRIFSDRLLYQKMSGKALDWSKRHEWQNIAKLYLNLYTAGDDNG